MSVKTLVIDLEKCSGCRICEVGCSLKNVGDVNPVKSRIRIIKLYGVGTMKAIPVNCMRCEDPPCLMICPMNAISTDTATGARQIDKLKCIGCSACMYACPFGAIDIDRQEGHAFTCSLCDGDPTCARLCPTGAINYADAEEVNMQLRRIGTDRYVKLYKASES